MNINYESYKFFYTVAIHNSITKASEILHVSQPAVTWQIKSLEEQLNTQLFNRNKKGVTLTEEGKIFFEYIKNGIDSFRNGEIALMNLKNLDYGTIRIGASTTVSKYVLLPIIEKFHSLYPKIEIKIVNSLSKNLIDDLRKGNLDILFLNLPIIEAPDLQFQKLYDVQDIFIGNKHFYDETKGSILLQDLKKYPLLFQKKPSNTREYLDQYLQNNQTPLTPSMEIVSYNLIMDFVKSGFGIGYATKEFIKKELNDQLLYEIKVMPKIPKRSIGFVTLKKSIPNYSVKKLLEIICQ